MNSKGKEKHIPFFSCRKCAQVTLQVYKRINMGRGAKVTNPGYVGKVFSRQTHKLIRALVKAISKARRLAQWLRVCIALPEGLHLDLSNNTGRLTTTYNSSFRGSDTHFWSGICGYMLSCIHTHHTHVHK